MEKNIAPKFSVRQRKQCLSGRRDSISMAQKYKIQDPDETILPSGVQNFLEMVTQYPFFIDKTLFIRHIIKKMKKSIIMLRPRRFGKSLLLSMLKMFFEKKFDKITGKELINQYRVIFCGGEFSRNKRNIKLHSLKIAQNYLEIVNQYQGNYPLIYLDFKGFQPSTLEQFLKNFKFMISRLCERFYYLKDYFEKKGKVFNLERFMKFLNQSQNYDELINSLSLLTEWLYQYHGKQQIVLLVDEFDHPITHMFYNNCNLDQRKYVKKTILNILSLVLKSDNNFLFKGILIGIMDVFSSDDDSGLNNCQVLDSTTTEAFHFFGFTQQQIQELVLKLLKEKFRKQYQNDLNFQLTEIMNRIEEWYNGYEVSKSQIKIFNPFSVIEYLNKCILEKKIGKPGPQWTSTKSYDFLKEVFQKMTPSLFKNIEQLVLNPKACQHLKYYKKIGFSKITLQKPLTEKQLTYILLHSGYLTGSIDSQQMRLIASIPNNQILEKLSNLILGHVYQNFIQKLPPNKQIQANFLSKINLEESNKIKSILDFILEHGKEHLGQPNQYLFSSVFYSFLYRNERHRLSLQIKVRQGGRLGHIFYPREKTDSTCVIIHQYKYDDSDQNRYQKCKDALWQIYSKKYLSHALTEKEITYTHIIVRGIVICNNKWSSNYDFLVSLEECHTLDEARAIYLFFNSLNQQEEGKAKQLYQQDYRQKKSAGTILRVIWKMFYEEGKSLTSSEYNTRQRILLKNIFQKVNTGENSDVPILQSQKQEKQDNFFFSFIDKKTPARFSYDQVMRNIRGIIGEDLRAKKNMSTITINFLNKFRSGPSLFNASVEQILSVDGMEKQYAMQIFMDIKKMKECSDYYSLPKKRFER